MHSIYLTFKKLKGPWLFRTPASFPSTVKGLSDDETKASFPDHSIEFTHLEFPAQTRIKLHIPRSKDTIVKTTIMTNERTILQQRCLPILLSIRNLHHYVPPKKIIESSVQCYPSLRLGKFILNYALVKWAAASSKSMLPPQIFILPTKQRFNIYNTYSCY